MLMPARFLFYCFFLHLLLPRPRRYEWNEWALRRQALRILHLRQSATTSAQTDASHFRRDNDTQVHLPRESGTQTGVSVGSNTARVVRYFAGLRGGTPVAVLEAATAAAVARGALAPSDGRGVAPAAASAVSTGTSAGGTAAGTAGRGLPVPPGTRASRMTQGVTVMTMTLDV